MQPPYQFLHELLDVKLEDDGGSDLHVEPMYDTLQYDQKAHRRKEGVRDITINDAFQSIVVKVKYHDSAIEKCA